MAKNKVAPFFPDTVYALFQYDIAIYNLSDNRNSQVIPYMSWQFQMFK